MLFQVLKKILLVILATLAIFLQFSFIPALPSFFWSINLPLAIVLVFLIFFGLREAVLAAFFSGFLMDSWHFSPFGVYLFTFLVVIFLAQLILNNWLTDRSLYSFLALSVISSLAFNIFWSLLNFLFSFGRGTNTFFLFSWGFIKYSFFSIPWLLLICGASFVFLSLVSRRLKPVFLNKR